jgi:hypothetical protein
MNQRKEKMSMIDLLLWVLIGAVAWFLYPHVKRNIDDIFFNRKMKVVREYVLGYKRRCTGMNRFVVTKESLQDLFREHDNITIDRMWLQLVQERIIEQDPMDNEWCIK